MIATATETAAATGIDEGKLNDLLGRAIVDFGAALQAPLMLLGEQLGLYRALAGGTPLTSSELAARTGTLERYVRAWARSQAAAGYVTYDPATDRYALSPEQVLLVADENSPAFVLGAFEMALGASRSAPRLAEAFKSGQGIAWHEHDEGVFHGCERFYRPGYIANLVRHWIPALDGVAERLRTGARVADVGCGHGTSTLLMAQAFPASSFVGYDYHAASVAAARARAEAARLPNVVFATASATDYTGRGFALVTMFDCLHDLGDPVRAARHAREALAPGGTLMLVEPRAGDRVEDNLNPLGRAFYAGSALLCTPNAVGQGGELTLGAQAGEAAMRVVLEEAGFTRFRLAADTPFHLVFEARP